MRGGPAQVRLVGRGGPDGYVWVLFRVHGSRLRLLFELLTHISRREPFRVGHAGGSLPRGRLRIMTTRKADAA